MIKGVSMAANTELTMDQLKNGTIYAQDNVDDLVVLRAALDALQYSTLTQNEKENVINNARTALAGVTGYIHGAKGL